MKSKPFIVFLLAVVLVYIIGLPIDIMEVDAAQYAAISFEMFETGEYLQLYCRGYDYLDKPPFLFWLNQVFFFLFGVHDWSFKLGNLIFILLGLYSTFKLGKLLYNESVARIATLILATTQAWFLISHDVKTDGILASAIIFTVWQWKLFVVNNSWKNLVGLSLGIAIGMLTKGPLGLVVPAMVMLTDLIINKKWKFIFNLKYLLGGIIILTALFPMLYGLYIQYDLHPGKTVSGNQVVDSGLKFYFWTQSFGRLTGESTWKNGGPIYYFLPEIAWAFIPWSVFIIQSMIFSFRNQWKQHLIPLAGFILPLIALSLSKFKLSHYIFICFPFIALIVANYLSANKHKILSNGLSYLIAGIFIPGIIFLGYCFQIPPLVGIITSLLIIGGIILVHIKKYPRTIYIIAIIAIGTNFFMHGFIYPALLKYQSFSMLAKEYVKEEPDKQIPLIEVGTWTFSPIFYAKTQVKNYANIEHFMTVEKPGYYWLYLKNNIYPELQHPRIRIEKEKIYDHFSVTRLKGGFIWPGTREKYISKIYLVKVYLQ